jgi:hypothetical protein
MKRSLTQALGVCTLLVLLGGAQARAQGPTIGFKVGPTWSKLNFEGNNDGNDWLTSFGGGGFIRFGFSGFSLQPEILAVTKGSAVDPDVADARLKLDYIEVPIELFFSLGAGSVAPYVLVGPAFAFEIKCSVDAEFLGNDGSFECDNDASDRKTFDIGAVGGLGLNFRAGPGSVLVEGRYTHGLMNLNDANDSNSTVRNRSIALFAGYSIALGSTRSAATNRVP